MAQLGNNLGIMGWGEVISGLTLEIKKFILDTLFPAECLGCSEEGKWLCDNCFEKIRMDPRFMSGKFIDRILTFYSYDSELLKRAIRALKYRFIEELSVPLGRLFIKGFEIENFRPDTNFFIIPVPLHRKRFLERGFNQAELLARGIAGDLGIRVENKVLERIRLTAPQVNLEEKERQKNVNGAFKISDFSKILNKKIILIDDVLTTGATMEACAKALKAGGAKEIWGVALAKG